MDKPIMRQSGRDTTQTWHYEKDLKSNYCISGSTAITITADGNIVKKNMLPWKHI